jgi:glycosyltransferase involved in cell wall biosynthesis
MKLSFVIPAHNEELYLGNCLDSIVRELKSGNYDAEIIVVDNASTDKTKEVAARYPGVKIVYEPRKGLVRARRAGFLASTGDLIANVDADTRLTPGWIEKVIKEFSKNPKLAALSGPFIYYDLPKKINYLVKIFYYIAFLTYFLNRFIFRLGSMLQGGNFVVRRSALEKIGGYNTDIYFYGEDTDLACRLHNVGQVKWTFDLPIYASGRRLANEGTFTMGARYGLNYFSMILFKKPYSRTSIDIRAEQAGRLPYKPRNKTKEWLLASAAALIFIIFIAAAGWAGYRLVQSGIVGFVTITEIRAEAQKLKDKFENLTQKAKNNVVSEPKFNETGE